MSVHLTRKGLKPIIVVLAVGLSIFQILFTSGIFFLDAKLLRNIHLAFIIALTFLWIPSDSKKDSTLRLVIDIALAVLGIAAMAHLVVNHEAFTTRLRYVDPISMETKVYCLIAVLVIMELTRRTAGVPMAIVVAVFLSYAAFGDMLPPPLRHNGISMDDMTDEIFIGTEGIFGVPLGVAAGMIFAFGMFGAFLERSNMSALFMDLACLFTRKSRGGPAKVSIFASALFGTISGSAPANVYGTGTFTIPLMKKAGYSPAFAGAVEATASTGGQLMPPIMGTAAFVMADLAGTSYTAVAKAALLPSILFYFALFMMIHFEAVRKNLGLLPEELIPSKDRVVSRLYYLLPVFLLVALLIRGKSLTSCAYIATLSIVLLAAFRKESRFDLNAFIDALVKSARNSLMISACCASAGIIIAVIALTGVGYKFMSCITLIAGDHLFLLMIVLMLTCMILGMGVPTTPAYIIVATLGVPALVKFGVTGLAAHMFVFYYAILACITPPVCIAAFAGASIAEARAMETGWISAKLGIVAFIIPFMFIYEPALLLEGNPGSIIMATLSALVGVVSLSGGLQGYLLAKASLPERLILTAGGLCLIYPGVVTDLTGLGALALVIAVQSARRRSLRNDSAQAG